MKCEEVKINLPEYIDGKLEKTDSGEIEKHLQSCTECSEIYTGLNSFLKFTDSFPEIDPPTGMKEEFMKLVDAEFGVTKERRLIFPDWLKVAAMVFIVLGTFVTGYYSGSKNKEVQKLNYELAQLKQEVMLAGLRDYSGPQKIEAVYSVKNSEVVGDQMVNALVFTMNSDKNVNVRLAAINALSEMMDKNENIKKELINSLSIQENPLLQISLIQILSESGVKEAKQKIESISQDENTNQQVRDFAKDMVKII